MRLSAGRPFAGSPSSPIGAGKATRRGVNADMRREKRKTQPEAVKLADKQEEKHTAMPAVRGRFVDEGPKSPCGR